MLDALNEGLILLRSSQFWVELCLLVLNLSIPFFIAKRLGERLTQQYRVNSVLFGKSTFDGLLFPLLALCLTYVAYRGLLYVQHSVILIKWVLPMLMSLAAIRSGVKVLQIAFPNAKWVRPIERTISWVAWLSVVLWITGWLPLLLKELEQITWKVGNSQMSIRTLLEGILTSGAVLLGVLWLSSIIEAKLLAATTGGELSLRKAISNAVRALMIFVGLIVSLSSVGIDLTALSVLGGAIGVGLGFGLQKLAANYVSGFVILAERSMRIGDNVRVDNFEGLISNINARYTVIRSVSGRESIVPNEMMIVQRVENLSLADARIWQSTVVSVGYNSDVDLVMRLLLNAALSCGRILRDPAPSVALSAFGADGLEFTVGYWINDPQNGTLGLKSSVNLAILRSLRENNIEIPFPQRVLHFANNAPNAHSIEST